MKGPV